MLDIITVAAVTFLPLWYIFQVEWHYQANAKSIRDLVVLAAVTFFTNLLFFVYIVVEEHKHESVYYLLVFAIGGPFVDLVTRTYPSTGSMCHLVSLLFFLELRGLKQVYLGPGVAIVVLATVGFLSTRRRGSNVAYIRAEVENDKRSLMHLVRSWW